MREDFELGDVFDDDLHNALIQRLVIDQQRPAVVLAASRVLLPSLYPPGADGPQGYAERVRRCLSLLNQNDSAAVTFYSVLYKSVSCDDIAHMAIQLAHVLMLDLDCLQRWEQGKCTSSSGNAAHKVRVAQRERDRAQA